MNGILYEIIDIISLTVAAATLVFTVLQYVYNKKK